MNIKALGTAVLLAALSLPAWCSDNAHFVAGSLKGADGETVFQNICQGCHMPDAKGAKGAGTYPALTGNPKLASAAYMAAVILNGRKDMPSFSPQYMDDDFLLADNQLTDEQIAGVINYVRTHFGNHYSDRITAADVAAMHPAQH